MTLCAYAGSFTGPFVLDDIRWIVKEPRVRSLAADWRNLGRDTRPLFHLSIAANRALGGVDVRGYHAFNLAVHAVAGLLLFGLVRRTLWAVNRKQPHPMPADGLALAVALLWLVHPLQTESVTYVVQRCESMMGLFFLLCLYAIVRGSQSCRPWAWYLTAAIACGLGMGCKEVMVTVVPVALLFDRIFLASSWREVARRRGILYAVLGLAALTLVAFSLSTALGGEEGVGFGLQKVTAREYLRSQPGVILHYLRLAGWPHPLCLDYKWPVAESPMEIYLPAAVVAGLVIASLAALWYRPWLGFLGLSFFLVLAPTSSILPIVDLAVEHRMYLPLAAVIVLAVIALYGLGRSCLRTPETRRLAGLGVLAAVTFLFTVMTWRRNADYRDDGRLWATVIAVAPHNYRAHHSLGQSYVVKGDLTAAKRCYERALQLRPEYWKSNLGLGYVRLRLGERDEAARHLQRAANANSESSQAILDVGDSLLRDRRYPEAVACYRAAVQAAPRDADRRRKLGLALHRSGREREAAAAFREALRLDPGLDSARLQLAWLLSTAREAEVRNGSEAGQLVAEVHARVGQSSYRVFDVLAATCAEQGRYGEACRAAAKAVELAEARASPTKLADLRERLSLYRRGQPYREAIPALPQRPAAEASGGKP